MKLRIHVLIFIAAAAVLCGAAAAERASRELSGKLVRLHVVANSDTAADQEQKLRVRDAVLRALEEELEGVTSPGEARVRIRCALSKIEEAARAVVESEGCDYAVSATLLRENFPTTEYDTFSLPAGAYTSLRVTIGEGAGHNWWCVVFPPMCGSASMEEAAAAGLTSDDISLMTGRTGGYVVRFRVLELWGRIKALFEA